MSTKLYNGIKFKTDDIYQLFEELKGIKEKAIKIGMDNLCSLDTLCHFILNNKLSDSNTYEVKNALEDNLRGVYRTMLDPLFNFSILIFPYKGKLYGYYFDDDLYEYGELIKDISDDYSYQNQTDRPEGISEEEYEERKKVWEGILGYDTMSERGLRYNFVSIDTIFDDNERFKRLMSSIKEALEYLKRNGNKWF